MDKAALVSGSIMNYVFEKEPANDAGRRFPTANREIVQKRAKKLHEDWVTHRALSYAYAAHVMYLDLVMQHGDPLAEERIIDSFKHRQVN
jgi:hypothetical protein